MPEAAIGGRPSLPPIALLPFRQNYVVHLYIHFGDLEARQLLYAVDHLLAHGIGHLRDRTPVEHVHRYIRRRLPLADVYGEAAGTACATREVVYEFPDGGRGVTGQPGATVGRRDAVYFIGHNSNDGGHHGVLYRGGAEITVQWALPCVLRVGTAHQPYSFPRRSPHAC